MSILTAIGKTELKNKLEKNGYNVFEFDLQYQEAVIDVLNKNKEIDIMFLNSLLPGEMTIYEFINKIRKINPKIKIIIILEKENEELISFLNSKNIFDIFYNNKIKIEELINLNLIKNKNNEKNKNLINKKIINKKLKYKKIINKIINFKKIKTYKKNNNKNNKIINIIGPPGSGKTIFTIIFSLLIKNKKILIIDLDENKIISKILGIKNDKNFLEEIQYNKHIFVLNLNKKICTEKEAKNIFFEKIKKFDKIILDYSGDKLEFPKEKGDLYICLTEPNFIQINKTKEILESYIFKYNMDPNKIKLIFNKHNFYSIDMNLLKNIFYKFNIIGKIKLNNKYNLIINKNIKIIDKEIKKDFFNIIKKIE